MKSFFAAGCLMIFSGAFLWVQSGGGSVADVPSSPSERNKTAENARRVAAKPTVLVELFTSQGCPTCPPADRLLSLLNKKQPVAEADIITLSLHVDYWDSPGWKDEFSSPLFSRRQDIYSAQLGSENYTPQMVVDGQAAFIGSRSDKAEKAIRAAVKAPKAKIELALNQDKLKIKITDTPAHENATIFLAIAEDDLRSSAEAGVGSGRRHAYTSVVRELKSLAMLTAQQTTLESEHIVTLQPVWKKENLKFVVFIQENKTRRMLGAAELLFATPHTNVLR